MRCSQVYIVMQVNFLNYCSNVTQYIPHIGNVCGATGMDFQEDPFHGKRESEKRAHCCSSIVLIINDRSQ